MAFVPKLTDAEWATISAVLPASGGVGRPRKGDREAIAALLYSEVMASADWGLQSLLGRKAAASLVVKRARWREDGTWPRIHEAGLPVMCRLYRRRYGGDEPMARLMRHLTIEARRSVAP